MGIQSQVQWFYSQFVEALRLVAADYDVQIIALPSFVMIPDEVAITFNSAVLLLDQVEKAGLIGASHLREAIAIDSFFGRKSGKNNNEFWTLAAMKGDREWEYTRQVARALLASLNEQTQPPELGWITYVRGK